MLLLLLLAVAAASCSAESATNQSADQTTDQTPAAALDSAPDSAEEQAAPAEPADPVDQAEPAAADTPVAAVTPTAVPTATPHPLADDDYVLPPAPIGFDQLSSVEGPQPVSIEIENINVRQAEIIAVGVNEDDLSLEVPPAEQVGWYEFGPSPGEPGSSVLAAHIAYNGIDGVFRYLEDVEIGSIVVIGFDDGTTSRYRIEEVIEYTKEELPDSLFSRDGREQLALITCGGAFNYQLDSYESNTVAIAVPI